MVVKSDMLMNQVPIREKSTVTRFQNQRKDPASQVSATPRLSADGRRIHFTFAAPSVNFDLIEPSVDQDVQGQVQR